MGIIKKKVRKLEDQLEYESRRWETKPVFLQSFTLGPFLLDSQIDSDYFVFVYFTFISTINQIVERCDAEPEAERHWRGNRCQTSARGETESWGQREEGEGAAVGDEGETVFIYPRRHKPQLYAHKRQSQKKRRSEEESLFLTITYVR